MHYGHGEPALSVWVSHNPITTIRMNEKGDLAVAGEDQLDPLLLLTFWAIGRQQQWDFESAEAE